MSEPVSRSASVTTLPALDLSEPTAVQAVSLVHDTCRSSETVAPEGLGVAWLSHSLPFQANARVETVPEALVDEPTPMHVVELTQEEPDRDVCAAPLTAASAWTPIVVSARVSAIC